jgi:diguanylate cyclase (GGDEF)-like protein
VTRRFTQGDQNRRELEVLHRLAVELPRTLTMTGVTDLLAEHLVLATRRAGECTISSWDAGCDRLTIMSVYELGSGIVEVQRGEQFALDDWPHSRALLADGTAYGEYRRDDPAWNQRVRDQLDEWGWQTWIALPLAVEARSVGLIEVVDHQTDERWSPHDIAFCQTIASQAAMAVRNAQLYEDLQRRADRDSLTGLLNHRAFYERLGQELSRAQREGTRVGVMTLDLDDFKSINDTRGHLAGDRTLALVAEAMRESSRDSDVAGRLGGDEFALILPSIGEDIELIARRLLASILSSAGVAASLGIAVSQPTDRDPLLVMAHADRSLLEAKRSGKKTYRMSA